ncbi:hypothetical protein GWK48_08770 [Metallosphaera tengchongensis]|uniref:Uncharacterized protein n=1 Tax=Metallosphaera tengchongensis TaxID=1532350 RepID=A0A6N0NUP8_9CREN|nr:hypothetical protein [Metallosphaera tengchongensis]QKR00452.1 hypothetical protein GWK48_08770 [Metallosphaera tengchongensis]
MKSYSYFLLGSSICLIIGGYELLGTVPLLLTVLTYSTTVVLIALAFFIERGNQLAIKIGVVLGILAIGSSTASSAHLEALSQFGSDVKISVLDLLMVMGFYVFPGLYILTWLYNLRRRAHLGKD